MFAIHLPAREKHKQNGFLVSYRKRRRNFSRLYEAAVPTNTNKTTKFGLAVFTSTILLFLAVKLFARPTQNESSLILFSG